MRFNGEKLLMVFSLKVISLTLNLVLLKSSQVGLTQTGTEFGHFFKTDNFSELSEVLCWNYTYMNIIPMHRSQL